MKKLIRRKRWENGRLMKSVCVVINKKVTKQASIYFKVLTSIMLLYFLNIIKIKIILSNNYNSFKDTRCSVLIFNLVSHCFQGSSICDHYLIQSDFSFPLIVCLKFPMTARSLTSIYCCRHRVSKLSFLFLTNSSQFYLFSFCFKAH